jgi:hypothetical protein
MPATHCAILNLEPQVSYLEHLYRIEGTCVIGDVTGTFDIHAVWKRKEGHPSQGMATIDFKYLHDCQLYVKADCPEDPLLYDVNCTNRLMSSGKPPCPGDLTGAYHSAFIHSSMPEVLNAAQKAALQAKDQPWPTVPPTVLVPSSAMPPKSHYKNAGEIPLLFKLPIKEGKPQNWKVGFRVYIWNNTTKAWNWGQQLYSEPGYRNKYTKDYYAKARLDLTDGAYRLTSLEALYYEDTGFHWSSGQQNDSVLFWVGDVNFRDVDAVKALNAQPPFKRPPTNARAPIKNPSRISTTVAAPPPVIQHPKDGQVFTEPATVIVRVQAQPGQLLVYELGSPQQNGSCAVQKKSTDGRFLSLGAGDYCLRVADKRQTDRAATVRFEVKPRSKTIPGAARDSHQGDDLKNDALKKNISLPRR